MPAGTLNKSKAITNSGAVAFQCVYPAADLMKKYSGLYWMGYGGAKNQRRAH